MIVENTAPLSPYTSLKFWVNGGTGGLAADTFAVAAWINGASVGTTYAHPTAIPANTWTQITVPLATLTGGLAAYDAATTTRQIWFLDKTGVNRPNIYLDQIEFTGTGTPTFTNTVAPSITGTATIGSTLTRVAGTYTLTPTTNTVAWQKCDTTGANCVAISGATGNTYVVLATDAGSRIRILETATNGTTLNTPSTPTIPTVVASCPTPVRIMPLGDSLTAFSESYRGPLYRTLVSQGYSIDFVGPGTAFAPVGGGDPDHAGYGGYRIGPNVDGANIDELIGTIVPNANPQIILLNIGRNDLAAGGQLALDAPAKLAALVARLQTLAPNAYILTSPMTPSSGYPSGGGTPEILALDNMAASLGNASATDKVIFVPILSRVLVAGFNTATDTTDGTHMSVSGGIKFADAWLPSVQSTIALVCP
jgi:hypothetical protein